MGIFSSLFGGGKPAAKFVISNEQVFVRGWTEAELKQILADFQPMYCDRLPQNFSTEIQSSGGDVRRIVFSTDMDSVIFCFLVNYLQYPKKFDLESRAILVAGRAAVGSDFLPAEGSLVGRQMTFYIPANDKQYDVVFASVEGRSYEFPFSSARWRLAKDPRLPSGIDDLK